MTSEVSLKQTPSATPTMSQQHIDKAKSASKRIDVESLANDLRKKLGSNWDKYQTTISLFLVGRLSRYELTNTLGHMLTDSNTVRMHNQLLLANLANALRDGPAANQSKYSFGAASKKQMKRGVKQSSEYEKLKKDIMNLPIRERHRIKMITRESGKQKMAQSMITYTRQSLLPKIPCVLDDNKNIQGSTIEWTQDINHAINTPLSIETFSLPEPDQLKTRMLGISREHGVTGALDKDVVEMMYHGLEAYLKNIVESAIDTVRYRKRKYTDYDFDLSPESRKLQKVILTNEDIVDTLTIQPFLVEPSGPLYRLHSVALQDDEYIEPKTHIDELVPQQTVPGLAGVSMSLDQRRDSFAARKKSPLVQKEEIKKDGESGVVPEDTNVGTREELTLLVHDILSH